MKRTTIGMAACMVALGGATGCGSDGGDFGAIETSVVGTCGSCHDVAEFEALLTEIRDADDALFTEAAFPDAMFPLELRERSVQQIIERATPARDTEIPPTVALRKAWILSQMHELDIQLRATPSSDFTSQDAFDEYNGFGGEFPQGCETIDRLDRAADGLSSQMPPLYTEPLFEVLGREFVELTSSDRAAMRDFVLGSLPSGASSCFL